MKKNRNKYEDIIKQNNEKKKQELIQKLKENEETYDYRKFQSRYMDRIIENEYLSKEKQHEEEERRKEYRAKMREYDEIIKPKYAFLVFNNSSSLY